jgi:hypothetical protein
MWIKYDAAKPHDLSLQAPINDNRILMFFQLRDVRGLLASHRTPKVLPDEV